MRLSDTHKEIARLMASGLKNKEISQLVGMTPQRISILRHNPLMRAEIEKVRKLRDEGYVKVIEVFTKNSEKIANELVKMVDDPNVPHVVRKQAAEVIISKLESKLMERERRSERVEESNEEEWTFEQVLRVSKKERKKEEKEEKEIDESDVTDVEFFVEEKKEKKKEKEKKEKISLPDIKQDNREVFINPKLKEVLGLG